MHTQGTGEADGSPWCTFYSPVQPGFISLLGCWLNHPLGRSHHCDRFSCQKVLFSTRILFSSFSGKVSLDYFWGGMGKEAEILRGYFFRMDLKSDLASFWLLGCSKLLAHIFYVECFSLSLGLECCSLGNKFYSSFKWNPSFLELSIAKIIWDIVQLFP